MARKRKGRKRDGEERRRKKGRKRLIFASRREKRRRPPRGERRKRKERRTCTPITNVGISFNLLNPLVNAGRYACDEGSEEMNGLAFFSFVTDEGRVEGGGGTRQRAAEGSAPEAEAARRAAGKEGQSKARWERLVRWREYAALRTRQEKGKEKAYQPNHPAHPATYRTDPSPY
jgi:hypothetical protein